MRASVVPLELVASMPLSPLTATLATPVSPLLAHQGGWDEILLVAGPIAVIVVLLAIVKRRIDAKFASSTSGESSTRSPESTGDALDGSSDPT